MTRTPTPISLKRAQTLVSAAVPTALAAETVAIDAAQGRMLAEPVAATYDVPGFANSAMDGFAIQAGPAGRTLRIVSESAAGAPATEPVDAQSAVRISTGAPMPSGAQAVIQLEACTEDANGSVLMQQDVAPGRNVRAAGEDMRAGAIVLEAGLPLDPAALAVAVGAGRANLLCTRRPRIAILTTGNELRAPGEPLLHGQIHNSNATALRGLALQAGAELSGQASVGDSLNATREALVELLAGADLLVATGGVSVGPHDHVKPALEQIGCSETFWGISIRPGKMTWFGESGGTPVFGLPGNPVSAIVIFMLLVRPALAALQGARRTAPDPIAAVLAQAVQRHPDRTDAVRVALEHDHEGRLTAHPTVGRGSHVTTSLLNADGLALIEPGDGAAPAGSSVAILPIR